MRLIAVKRRLLTLIREGSKVNKGEAFTFRVEVVNQGELDVE